MEERRGDDIDGGRIKRFAVWGVIDAFMTTKWYSILGDWSEGLFPEPPALDVDALNALNDASLAVAGAVEAAGTNWTKVAFEVAADQVLYCPVWFIVFFTYGGIYEKRPFGETLAYMQKEMIPAVTTSWWVWVPVMTVSFGFIAPELRVPYYLAMSFGYAMVGLYKLIPADP